MRLQAIRRAAAIFLPLCAMTTAGHAAGQTPGEIRHAVDAAIEPVMTKYRIPGMAIGIVADGKPYLFNYGVASRTTGKPVTRDTLFELGSVSKTLTATLASFAQESGYLALSDPTEKFLPALQGTAFGKVSLLNLGTHTPGGMPLQVPDDVDDDAQLMAYLKAWKPAYTPGAWRTYANPGIGTLGLITAQAMKQDFAALVARHVFAPLGMTSSYYDVPRSRMPDYAQGYTKQDKPIRVAPGVLDAQAYGVKTTAADMIRFVQANMRLLKTDATLQRAITATHTGYFKAGVLTQDLIWEQYSYPVDLKTLLEGNSSAMALQATPATELQPPMAPLQETWINKTGSTNGFGAYVAFVPSERLGIVILANKNSPIDDRVAAAHQILSSLAGGAAPAKKRP